MPEMGVAEQLLGRIHPNKARIPLLMDPWVTSSSCLGQHLNFKEAKKERVKSVALKAKKKSSDDETSTSGSDDEEYAMVVRNFQKFFRRKGKFVGQPREEKKSFRQRDEKKGKSDRKYFRCGDPNHLIGDCPKPSHNKDQKAFIGGSLSDSENDAKDKTNDETCLMAQSSNEITLNSSYCSDDASSLDNDILNKHTMKVEESLNVTFDESPPPTKLSPLVDDDVGEEEAIRKNTKIINTNNEEDESIEVDEIINIKDQNLCDDFAKIMHDEFKMSMMGELNFFMGLQIKQIDYEIFFNQSTYIKEMLKIEDSKPTKTPMSTEIKLTKDDEANSVDSSKYRVGWSPLPPDEGDTAIFPKCDESDLVVVFGA
uniref:Alpha/beta hydrolases superfamily protein n=1 Tax=Tanacetum cinerariifolium TaxID=118510 RepID=A0A6L2MU49_TANCI|nr:alpha/beta hydrolases superfamily protein [Tanacetum cinerariifolium]